MRAAAIAGQQMSAALLDVRGGSTPIAIRRTISRACAGARSSRRGFAAGLRIVPESIQVSVATTIEAALGELLAREFAVIVAVLSSDVGDIVEAIKQLKRCARPPW